MIMSLFKKKRKIKEENIEPILIFNAKELHSISEQHREQRFQQTLLFAEALTKKVIEEINSVAKNGRFYHEYLLDYCDKDFTKAMSDNLMKYGYTVEYNEKEIRLLKISW